MNLQVNQHVPKLSSRLNRRAFVISTATAGAGLALGLDLPFGGPSVVRAADGAPEVNAWVVIRPDDTVVIRIARSEMGQGTLTGLAQLVAEELECDWSKVTTEFPTPGQSVARKRAWGDFSTGGSRGIRTSQDYVRKGGATARVMLIQAAANEWKVPATECKAANSVITHTPSGKTTTYGKVAEAAAKLEPPADVKLKDPKDWTIAGKGLKRLDTVDKTTGKMTYGIDVKLPGMLNAAIKDCPVFGGKLKSFDEAKIARMKGVKKVVPVGDSAVAVVADTWWHAKTALDALPIVWDEGDNAKVSSETIAKWLAEGLDNAQPAYVGNQNGDAKAAIAGAAKKVEAVYSYPYQNHATMEPMNATVLYTPDKCEVWCGTQNGEAAFAAALEASGLPADKVDVHKLMLGGGFGRRGMTDYVRQAVAIAKQMPGTPIKLLWSREEDMQHGKYHPITQCKLTGAFDADNNLVALHYRLSGQSILFSVRPEALQNGMDPAAFQGVAQSGEAAIGYSVPNLLVEHAMRNPHVPPGFWRGVNVNHNAIYLECFMDELAQAVGQDPLEFRRKLMGKHPKHLAVLNAVAEKIGWGTPAPQGVYRGIAQVMGYGSYVAGAAEISVTDGSKIKVHRIVASTDPGYVVNPAQVERQIAGSFVYGLSALFYGGCTVKDGRIEQTNFDTYNSMRINEMPKVESVMVPSGGFWGGVGEPTIGVAAPAVLNAYFAATGKRIRTFPLRNQNISFA
ncbi:MULTISPECIES: xanthine dehydrogenase family protein molybdopterin-binding subunit [unclassified Bradyrhizobium]|uniref:xanthine dehydrogenase family protein molybdopterin-binding subunit n=1 Tax=unclassified Bradyrhizobium TaxID=2631580 RepID=UPI001BAE2699|nr:MULTISPECIES: molybdopterin cofactor-binding domain-containing protein [unclassified Bradyrhizobium]MBR1202004.1 xanthine dehydrogenase family protein molybdopterin-binding subunit [Bradyrhizobium sp. AUGA SZCCT0124]MBR1311427.1 xanthine dehydrogenase family protein molybdopterin-binding subunit [Bradyrhizobium sp. AUGA SZCCT0051]MBR1338953.1 xanthine dehydrogenase family protein molybdopterin-binding subunit [Bradyrhizobium sp. AUGA SZCCT0105]MBR1353527.1 xanthine dehydrogenase family prote